MKKILLINDVVGYSHVGMVAMMPILTYLGHPTYNLPTSLVSNTLDYGRFNVLDTTEYMRGVRQRWFLPIAQTCLNRARPSLWILSWVTTDDCITVLRIAR